MVSINRPVFARIQEEVYIIRLATERPLTVGADVAKKMRPPRYAAPL
jgi:hypothetical protein